MEDKIIVTIGEDHAYECSTDIIGRAGEGDTAKLENPTNQTKGGDDP